VRSIHVCRTACATEDTCGDSPYVRTMDASCQTDNRHKKSTQNTSSIKQQPSQPCTWTREWRCRGSGADSPSTATTQRRRGRGGGRNYNPPGYPHDRVCAWVCVTHSVIPAVVGLVSCACPVVRGVVEHGAA